MGPQLRTNSTNHSSTSLTFRGTYFRLIYTYDFPLDDKQVNTFLETELTICEPY